MDLFSQFCNICLKADTENLKNMCEESMALLKDTLITCTGQGDIINKNAIYLCRLCCEELIRFNKFREKCFNHLIELRQMYSKIKSKLELEEDAVTVTNILRKVLHAEVLRCKSRRKSNSTEEIIAINNNDDCVDSPIEILHETSEKQDSNSENFENSPSEDLQFDASHMNASNSNDTVQVEFEQEELDTKIKMEISASEQFDLKYFLYELPENEKFDVMSDVNIGNGCRTSQIQLTKETPRMQNNSSENIKLEEVESVLDKGFFPKEELHTEIDIENSISDDFELNDVNDSSEDFDSVSNMNSSFSNIEFTEQELQKEQENCISNVKESVNGDISGKENVKAGIKSSRKGQNNVDGSIGDIENNTFAGNEDNEKTCNRRKADVHRKGPQVCQHCHKQFRAPSLLIIHMRTHTGDRPYKCTICDKAFTTNDHLHRHARTHTNERPYKCNVCEKSFTLNFHLTTHQRIHTNTRPYKCTHCTKTFTVNSNLTTHMRVHTGQRPYKCSVCDKAFTRSDDLTKHKRVHTGQRPYKCSVCDKAFTDNSSLTVHVRVHSGERPYKCSVCDKKFTQGSNLTSHMRIHTGQRPYKCSVCDKAFTRSDDLTKHKRVHTGQRPYKCSVCDKAFTDNSSLTVHVRVHSGQRPYKCSVCDKKFTHSCNLTSHMRIHTGQRPYKCSVCDKAFTQSTALTKHKRTHGNTLTKPTC